MSSTSMPFPLVSVVLPCLDEVESVGRCVVEAQEALAAGGLSGEVIVADNGSSDGSAEAARLSGARVVTEERSGYGHAVRAGIAAARGSVIVMADADCSYDLAKIPELVRPILDEQADLVVGSRLNGASRGSMPILHRLVGTPAITFLIARAGGGTSVRDSQSGFRAFRRQAVSDFGLASGGMELASEMLIRASSAGLRLREVPTGYRPRVGTSKLNTFSDGWRHLVLILALAPDLLLVWPGAILAGIGVTLTLVGLISPSGIELGSLRWQPVFFSTIALVLGTQAILGGAVLAHRMSVVSQSSRPRFGFVGRPSFGSACLRIGVGSVVTGLVIDGVLLVVGLSGEGAPSRGLALAALAQSLLIVGATLAMFAIVSNVLLDRSERRESDRRSQSHNGEAPVAGAAVDAVLALPLADRESAAGPISSR